MRDFARRVNAPDCFCANLLGAFDETCEELSEKASSKLPAFFCVARTRRARRIASDSLRAVLPDFAKAHSRGRTIFFPKKPVLARGFSGCRMRAVVRTCESVLAEFFSHSGRKSGEAASCGWSLIF